MKFDVNDFVLIFQTVCGSCGSVHVCNVLCIQWDCSLGEWTYYPEEEMLAGCCESPDSSDDDDGFHARRYRSHRLRQKCEGRKYGKKTSRFLFLNH